MTNTAMPKNAPLIVLLLTQVAAAIIALVEAFWVDMTGEQVAAVLGAVGVLGTILALVLWAFTVSSKEVVERLIGETGQVVGGEANDMVETGEVIRVIGDET